MKSANPVSDEVAEDALSNTQEEVSTAGISESTPPVKKDSVTASLRNTLDEKLVTKKAEEERENYRVKLRRAYDVGLEMQRKGLLSTTKTALDKQVDNIMSFDDNAFEAFKRSIGNARAVRSVKIASDLGGVNIGVESDSSSQQSSNRTLLSADGLAAMWE